MSTPCEKRALTGAQSPWAALPKDLLVLVVAAAAPHARSLPELLAPSRVCRAWSAAYRDDELWRALHAALGLGAGAVADDAPGAPATPGPSWRERVASATLGLSLLDRGAGPGATELPLQEALAGAPRLLRDSLFVPLAGGHVCVLCRGRLTVVHLPGSRGVTSVLNDTCADRVIQRTVVPWAGASVAVTACGPHASRLFSVVEITPLSCCGDAFGHQVGLPALRLEEEDEVSALDAAELADGTLLLAVAVRGDKFTTVKARLVAAAPMAVVWTRELQLPAGCQQPPLLRVDPRSGDVVVAAGKSIWLWPACSAHAGGITSADALHAHTTVKASRIWALTLQRDGGLCVGGYDVVRGAIVLLFPALEGGQAGKLPSGTAAIELLRRGDAPLWARSVCVAALGSIAVTSGDGDVELFHSRSGRYLGRVFTSAIRGRFRWERVRAAPASFSEAAAGIMSWRTGPRGAQLLLHPPQIGGARGACDRPHCTEQPAEEEATPAATAVTVRKGWC